MDGNETECKLMYNIYNSIYRWIGLQSCCTAGQKANCSFVDAQPHVTGQVLV